MTENEQTQLDLLPGAKAAYDRYQDVKKVENEGGPETRTNETANEQVVPKTDEKKAKKEKNVSKKEEKGEEFTWPFGFAVGAKRMNPVPMPGAKEGAKYTRKQIIDVLKPLVLELKLPGADLHYLEEDKMFVIKNILARKGCMDG